MPLTMIAGPSYLPAGYEFSHRAEGARAGGLGSDPSQVGLFYRRGAALEDLRIPLAVYIGPPSAPDLVATDGRQGAEVDLGVRRTIAKYHDGLWMLGQGEDEFDAGPVLLHWDRSTLHSVTVRWPGGTVAVRGPKARGVDYNELLKVARSLFPLEAGGT